MEALVVRVRTSTTFPREDATHLKEFKKLKIMRKGYTTVRRNKSIAYGQKELK